MSLTYAFDGEENYSKRTKCFAKKVKLYRNKFILIKEGGIKKFLHIIDGDNVSTIFFAKLFHWVIVWAQIEK
jgi:hypothetical protein